MSDGDVSAERLEAGLGEHLGDQSHLLVHDDVIAVAHRDAGRLLPAMLKRVEAEVGELGDLLAGGPDAEDSAGILGCAVVPEFAADLELMREGAVAARHEGSLRCRPRHPPQ